MEKVSAKTLFHPERLRIVIFVTRLFFPMRSPFDGFKLVPAHHAIPGVVAIGPYAALYPSARMLQMGTVVVSYLLGAISFLSPPRDGQCHDSQLFDACDGRKILDQKPPSLKLFIVLA